jgi:hypothetical protein
MANTLGQVIFEKLSGDNYILDRLAPVLDKTIQVQSPDKTITMEENPAYVSWYAQDQQVLNFLLNSVTKEVLGQVATKTSAAVAWCAILGMFDSQSRVQIFHLHSTLSNTCKGNLSCAAYYVKMKGFADEMAAASKRLDDEDVICCILAGLNFEFNPFVEAFITKTDQQTLNDLYSQLLTAEARVES